MHHVPQDCTPSTAKVSEATSLTELQLGAKFSRGLEGHHHRRDRILCLSLHVFLVLIHAVLFVVVSHHYEHSITMNINDLSTTWAPLAVGTVLQIFATVSPLDPRNVLRM